MKIKINIPSAWKERVLAYASRWELGDITILNWYPLGGGYLRIQRGYYNLYVFSIQRHTSPKQYCTIICMEMQSFSDESDKATYTYLFEFVRLHVFCAMFELKTRYKLAKERRYATILGGNVTDAQWDVIKAHYNYTCLCCDKQEPDITLTLDHILPRSKGGTSLLSNIQPLCRSCNSIKRDKTIDYRPMYFQRNALTATISIESEQPSFNFQQRNFLKIIARLCHSEDNSLALEKKT